MICVLVPRGDDSGETIADFETTEIPRAGDEIAVTGEMGQGVAFWRVTDEPPRWRIHAYRGAVRALASVFVTCERVPEEGT